MPTGIYQHQKLTETHKENIRQGMIGKNNWMKGKHPKSEFKKGHAGTIGSTGIPSWNKGLKGYMLRHKPYFIANGKQNPNWKGGISYEPYSTDWKESLKIVIREKYRYTCQLCKTFGKIVHHIDYNKKNCHPDNLIILCQRCHGKTNNKKFNPEVFANINNKNGRSI